MELTSSVWLFRLAELILAWMWEALLLSVTTERLELRESDLLLPIMAFLLPAELPLELTRLELTRLFWLKKYLTPNICRIWLNIKYNIGEKINQMLCFCSIIVASF